MKALLLSLLLAATPAHAEQVLFICYFDWVCDPNTKCTEADADIRFRVDIDANTVERIGGNSLSQFRLLLGDRALAILEQTISGGVTTTSIMVDSGDAVHSENSIKGTTLSPRQYLGRCRFA